MDSDSETIPLVSINDVAPQEIINEIIGHLHDKTSWANCRLTCHSWAAPSEELLFASIALDLAKSEQERFLDILCTRPEHTIRHLRRLLITSSSGSADRSDLREQGAVSKLFFDLVRRLPSTGLPRLEKLTIAGGVFLDLEDIDFSCLSALSSVSSLELHTTAFRSFTDIVRIIEAVGGLRRLLMQDVIFAEHDKGSAMPPVRCEWIEVGGNWFSELLHTMGQHETFMTTPLRGLAISVSSVEYGSYVPRIDLVLRKAGKNLVRLTINSFLSIPSIVFSKYQPPNAILPSPDLSANTSIQQMTFMNTLPAYTLISATTNISHMKWLSAMIASVNAPDLSEIIFTMALVSHQHFTKFDWNSLPWNYLDAAIVHAFERSTCANRRGLRVLYSGMVEEFRVKKVFQTNLPRAHKMGVVDVMDGNHLDPADYVGFS